MRTLDRNKTGFWYALFEGVEETLADGLATGEYKALYADPVKCYANISPSKTETANELFGLSEGYDKVIVLDNTPIDEYSILWIDKEPAYDEDGNLIKDNDYIVKKKAKSLNSVVLAVTKV